MAFELSVVTPEGTVVQTQVGHVVAPGQEGEFGVLPGHENFLMPLSPGVLRYGGGSQELKVAVASGFAEVTAERMTVLVDSAELPDQIDRERATAARDRALEEIQGLGTTSPEELASPQADLARAEARLEAGA
jgi:F-type H+-transporting ATPase subunit epsilon